MVVYTCPCYSSCMLLWCDRVVISDMEGLPCLLIAANWSSSDRTQCWRWEGRRKMNVCGEWGVRVKGGEAEACGCYTAPCTLYQVGSPHYDGMTCLSHELQYCVCLFVLSCPFLSSPSSFKSTFCGLFRQYKLLPPSHGVPRSLTRWPTRPLWMHAATSCVARWVVCRIERHR